MIKSKANKIIQQTTNVKMDDHLVSASVKMVAMTAKAGSLAMNARRCRPNGK